MYPQTLIFYVWDAWFVSWLAAAFWSARTATRLTLGLEAFHWVITVTGLYLILGIYSHDHQGPGRLWDVSMPLAWALLAATAASLGFCWWARLHLGRLWSGTVTRKEGHHVVDTGPYALVRHPIYTGMIAAAFATGVLRGTIVAMAGAALMTLGLWIKARLEERFLRRELGAAAYDAYRRRVPMLVPFWPA